jgi:hypothetical protein
MINPRTYLRHVVSTSIKRNQRVSIVTSLNDPNIRSVRKIPYLDFSNQISNTFEELENEIISQIESCVYDYPDEYVSLAVTLLPEGQEIIHVVYEPET